MTRKIIGIISLLSMLFAVLFVGNGSVTVFADNGETYILFEEAEDADTLLEEFGKGKEGGKTKKLELSKYITVQLIGSKSKMSLSLQGSKGKSEWPASLHKLYDLADNKGSIPVVPVKEKPSDSIRITAYAVRSTLDCTGCIYFSEVSEKNPDGIYETKEKVYFFVSELGDTSYIRDKSDALNHTMEGQVELRELSSEELSRLEDIRRELARDKNGQYQGVLKAANGFLHIVGVCCIVYGTLCLLCYLLDMFNPFAIRFEFYYTVTFRRWHAYELVAGPFGGAPDGSLKLWQAMIFSSALIMLGAVLFRVPWTSLFYELYTRLK